MVGVVCAVDEVLGLELEELVDLTANMFDCLGGLFFENLQFLILHLHFLDLVKLFVELIVEGVKDGGLEGEGATADC